MMETLIVGLSMAYVAVVLCYLLMEPVLERRELERHPECHPVMASCGGYD